ncbi:TonB-dependent hemoglobin/transferrin/lactoferrin family receptor [Kordiimonas pumila]|uniref:TonB-dependent hemoglobin/transferrin/lactoferrin family receptor n=1 Tax=Kordiimonas pumila TaxID=2161677 RepID=A0ABV7D6R2_9PROT|nr:TonB-dependent hemoglobin/transferrin/lactoferrin family receptor [Kordiimonas pumila]
MTHLFHALLTRPVKLTLCSGISILAVAASAKADMAAADITEITVSATKNAVPVFSVPASVSIISKEEIDDLVVSSVSDMFESVPGVFFDGGPRRTGEVPAIRGVQGEGVVILFDGVRQSFLSGHDGRFFIEPDLLKSAEVVRGSGSSLYGSGAVGGVITFNTVDAADLLKEGSSLGYRLSGGYQSVHDEWMQSAALFGKTDDGFLDGLVSFSFRNSGDISLGDGNSLQSDDNIGSGLAKGTIAPTDDLKLTFSWMRYANDAVEPNNGMANNTGDLMDKDIKSDTFRMGGIYNPDSNLIDLSFVTFINKAHVKEADLDTTRVINRKVKTTGFSLDNRSRFDLAPTALLTFTYGGEYYRDEQVGTDTDTVEGTRGGVPNAEAETLGLFLQAEFKAETALGDFYLVPGLRYDSFKNKLDDGSMETKESATSPKVALSWQPVPQVMIYGSYGEAFRAPSFNEIFADDVHFTIPLGPGLEASNFFIANTDLSAEKSKTWEVGAGLDFANLMFDDDRFVIKGSYFSSDVNDLIDLEVDFEFSPSCFVPTIPLPCSAGTSRNINTGSATLDGIEIEAVYDSQYFKSLASYSSVTGKDSDSGDYVGILSPNRFFVSGEFKVPSLSARLGARLTVASKFDKVNDSTEGRPSYETLDVFAVWQPKGTLDGLRVDAGLDNITDAAVQSVYAGVIDPGRNAKLRVSWTGAF